MTRMSAVGKKKRRSTGVCPQPNEGEEEDALVISDMPLRNAPEVMHVWMSILWQFGPKTRPSFFLNKLILFEIW